jgi:nitric oxide reductase activation protein
MKSGDQKHNQSGNQNGETIADTVKKLRRTIEILRQGIDDTRLTMLYNRFDLEATRRERDYWEKQFNDLNGNKN